MNCYIIKEVGPDGYVTLCTPDNSFQKEIPLRSAKIMFESGGMMLANPEEIYRPHRQEKRTA